jgi:hypothetical protein
MALRPSFWVNGLLGYGLVLAAAWWQSRFLSWALPDEGASTGEILARIAATAGLFTLGWGGSALLARAECGEWPRKTDQDHDGRDPRRAGGSWIGAAGLTLIALGTTAIYVPFVNKRVMDEWPATGLIWAFVGLAPNWLALSAWWRLGFGKAATDVWRSYVSAMARSPLLAFSGCFSAVVAALSWEFGPLLKRHLFMSAWTGWTFFAMAFMAYARALQLEVAPRHDADTCGSAKCVASQPGVPR